MNILDLGVLAVCGVVGWLVVSWVINLVRQQRSPPLVISDSARKPETGTGTSRGPSVAELARSWSAILGVREDASLEEIESAYHARLAECDHGAGQEAGERRTRIEDAYNFIRTARTRP